MNGIGMYPGSRNIAPDTFFGSVAITGTGAADCTVFKGSLKRVITSVTYSGTGLYTITFATGFTFAEVPNFTVSFVDTAAADIIGVIKQEFVNSTRTLVIQVFTANTGNGLALPTTAKMILMCEGRMTAGS